MKKTVKLGIITVIASFMSLFGLSVIWCLRTWRRLSMDELIYELSAPLRGTGSDMISRFIVNCLIPTVVIVATVVFFGIYKKKSQIMKWWLILSVVFAVSSAAVLFNKLNAYEYLVNMGEESTFIEDNYVDPGEVKLKFPEKKRNLIYIFLESMEITFSDIENGGGFDESMIPELTKLAEDNECFSGDDKLNGACVTNWTSWTIGGMFAQTSGLPLKISIQGNSMSEVDDFFPGVTCLGDILEKEGYNQELLIGSDATFGGRNHFFVAHGKYDLHDYNYALDNGIIPKGYNVFWGYEDEKLFENAKADLLELSKKDRPFNLTMLTVDTHFPDGYVCGRCENRFGKNQYANVIACSDKQIKEFVDWIQAQDFYDDTTVIICGDHTTMNDTFCDGISNEYERRTYTTIINPATEKKRKDTIKYATIDMFPTTLAAMGVDIKGNRLGLGTNLFSGEKTLLEKYGCPEVNAIFDKKSAFMEKMSGITDLEAKRHRKKSLFPHATADIDVTMYDKFSKKIIVKVDNIENIEMSDDVTATLYDVDKNEVASYKMNFGVDRSYTCEVDISSLEDRNGTVTIETGEDDGAWLGEISGDLSVQAHENIIDYIDLLEKEGNIAVLFASNGDFTSNAPEKDLSAIKELGINLKLEGEDDIGFFAVVDSPSIVYGSEYKDISYDGVFVGNDVEYHIESDSSGDCCIEIAGEDYAVNEKGLNCVVYDYDQGKVIDSACFDLDYAGNIDILANVDMHIDQYENAKIILENLSEYDIGDITVQVWDKDNYRKPLTIPMEADSGEKNIFSAEANIKNIDIKDAFIEITCHDTSGMQHKLYDWKGDLNLLKKELPEYLDYIRSMDDVTIIMSVKDDMWLSEDKEVVNALGKFGISEFSDIKEHEAYYAIVNNDGITENHSVDALTCDNEYKNMKYSVSSAGWDAGYYSFISINNEEPFMGERGINIAVYDTKNKRVIDRTTYRYVHLGGEKKMFVR
ncbi:MAG: LTA synthase family protein [Butyrivibrio sp.]|nr:LTA synthase family protein [Butyrivibrio sp.]